MHYRAISNMIRHLRPICKFSDVRESFTAKQKDRLPSLLILINVIEAKIFDYVFLEGHNV